MIKLLNFCYCWQTLWDREQRRCSWGPTCCRSADVLFSRRLQQPTWSLLYTIRSPGNPQTGTCTQTHTILHFLTGKMKCEQAWVHHERSEGESRIGHRQKRCCIQLRAVYQEDQEEFKNDLTCITEPGQWPAGSNVTTRSSFCQTNTTQQIYQLRNISYLHWWAKSTCLKLGNPQFLPLLMPRQPEKSELGSPALKEPKTDYSSGEEEEFIEIHEEETELPIPLPTASLASKYQYAKQP